MSDDFFTQIQDTEQKAEMLVEKAQKKLEEESSSYEKALKESREKEVDKKRKKYQEDLAQKNVEGRDVFEQKEKESVRSAQGLKKDAEVKLDKMLPALDAFFLGELLN